MDSDERADFAQFCAQASDTQLEFIVAKEGEFADVDEFRAECLQVALDEAESRAIFEPGAFK